MNQITHLDDDCDPLNQVNQLTDGSKTNEVVIGRGMTSVKAWPLTKHMDGLSTICFASILTIFLIIFQCFLLKSV